MPRMDGPRPLQALQNVNPKVCCCFLNERNVSSQPELLALGAARVFPKMPPLPELVQSLWLLAANVDEAELPILSISPQPELTRREGEAAAEPRLQERRACVRYLCHLDGSCQPVAQPATGESWLGKLRDISSTGVKILVNRRFEVGTLLGLAGLILTGVLGCETNRPYCSRCMLARNNYAQAETAYRPKTVVTMRAEEVPDNPVPVPGSACPTVQLVGATATPVAQAPGQATSSAPLVTVTIPAMKIVIPMTATAVTPPTT